MRLLRKKDPDPADEGAVQLVEDAECCALGNSFHTRAVACLADLILWTLGKKALKGPERIQEHHVGRHKDGLMCRSLRIKEIERVLIDEDSESVSSHPTLKANEKIEEWQQKEPPGEGVWNR